MTEKDNAAQHGCLVVPAPGRAADAHGIARATGLSLAADDAPPGLRLYPSERGLELRDTRRGAPGPVRVDFLDPAILRRLQSAGGNRELIGRAVGARRGHRPRVLDATAGLGADAAVLAAIGCTVHMVERHPALHALLRDGLERAAADPRAAELAGRLTLELGDAAVVLERLAAETLPEVVYLDPMYPQRRRGAVAGKAMQHLQALLGTPPDPVELFRAARDRARDRVVVKRPRKAAPLDGAEPDIRYTGSSTRFDVHLQGR